MPKPAKKTKPGRPVSAPATSSGTVHTTPSAAVGAPTTPVPEPRVQTPPPPPPPPPAPETPPAVSPPPTTIASPVPQASSVLGIMPPQQPTKVHN